MKRVASEAREIERLRTRLDRLNEVNRRMTESSNIDAALREIVAAACSLTDARYGAIAIGCERERRARVAMETERRRLSALIESSPVGVMVVDATTRTFASVNKEAERILGMSPEPGSTLVQYQSVELKPTNVDALVDDAKTAFLRRGARNAIEVDLDPNLPPIAADSRRIGQVLDNRLSNTSKYSQDSSTIRVSGSQDGFFVDISVTCCGRGIPSDQLTNLFSKFSRIDDDGRERNIAGEGLGLAICKGIVEAHGGRIQAENKGEGRGARITFTIPVAAKVPQEDSSAALV